MKLFGSLSELVNLIFRKDSQQITVRPSQSVTYITTTDVQLAPSTAATQVLVSEAATQTLTNKSINGDNNTLSNIAITSLKTGGSQYDVLLRDGSGAVVNGRLTNDSIATGAAIALGKLATVTANYALQSNNSGVISASSITSTELGHLSGVTSNIQTQLDAKVDENPAIVGATATKITFDSKGLVTAGTALAAGDMPSGIDATRIGTGSVDNTEFGYLNGLTSSAVGVSDSQVLLNKTISSTSLITGALTLPVGTQAQRPGSPVDGMIRYNSDSGSFEGRANGTWSGIGGGGGGSGDSIVDTVTQIGHGFVVGDVLYLNGNTYTKAIATSAATSEVVGIVSEIVNTDQFKLLLAGKLYGVTTTSFDILPFIIDTGFDSQVTSLIQQSDGKVIVGGNFTSYNGTSRNRITGLNSDGSLDTSFTVGTGFDNQVTSLVRQSDGKILVGGLFTSYNGTSRNRIARLNSDGSLDTSFTVGTGFDNDVYSIALQSDGKVIVVGFFTSYNGTSRSRIARLNSDGSLDTSFNVSSINGAITAVVVHPNGKITIGGNFTLYGASSRPRIAGLNSDGSLDTSFTVGTGFDNQVNSIIPTGTLNRVRVGGNFTTYNGTSRNRITGLNSDGSLDTSFTVGTGFDNTVNSLVRQLSDGKIIVGGNFTTYNGISRGRIARLNSDGSLDTGFTPTGTGVDNIVRSLALQSDGKVIIGGFFTSYNGISRNRIARLNSDGSLNMAPSSGSIIFLSPITAGKLTITEPSTTGLVSMQLGILSELTKMYVNLKTKRII